MIYIQEGFWLQKAKTFNIYFSIHNRTTLLANDHIHETTQLRREWCYWKLMQLHSLLLPVSKSNSVNQWHQCALNQNSKIIQDSRKVICGPYFTITKVSTNACVRAHTHCIWKENEFINPLILFHLHGLVIQNFCISLILEQLLSEKFLRKHSDFFCNRIYSLYIYLKWYGHIK